MNLSSFWESPTLFCWSRIGYSIQTKYVILLPKQTDDVVLIPEFPVSSIFHCEGVGNHLEKYIKNCSGDHKYNFLSSSHSLLQRCTAHWVNPSADKRNESNKQILLTFPSGCWYFFHDIFCQVSQCMFYTFYLFHVSVEFKFVNFFIISQIDKLKFLCCKLLTS